MESEAVTSTGFTPNVHQDWHATYIGSCSTFITSSDLRLTIQNKRKGDDGYGNPVAKTKRLDSHECSDLIVLGLPWKSSEDDLTKYFQQFGDLALVEVKRDLKTGQSKGFGFIRFLNYESQFKCCAQRHMIDGRWCDVTIPNSKSADRKAFGPSGGNYNQGGGNYSQGGRGSGSYSGWGQSRGAAAPGPVGGKMAPATDGMRGNLMNLVNSVVLLVTEVMFQNQGPTQEASRGNMGGGDHQLALPSQGGFGTMGGGSDGGSTGGNWCGSESSPSVVVAGETPWGGCDSWDRGCDSGVWS